MIDLSLTRNGRHIARLTIEKTEGGNTHTMVLIGHACYVKKIENLNVEESLSYLARAIKETYESVS